MAKKKNLKRRKVLQAVKQRRKKRLGGVFARAADRRKMFREEEALAPTTPTPKKIPKKSSVAKQEATTPPPPPPQTNVAKQEPVQTTTQPVQATATQTESEEVDDGIPPKPKISDFKGSSRKRKAEYERALKDWNAKYSGTGFSTATGDIVSTGTTTGTNTAGMSGPAQLTNPPEIDQTLKDQAESQEFIRDADTDVETLDTTSANVITQDDEIQKISREGKKIDPAEAVKTQDLTTTEAQTSQAKLAEGFDLLAFNDDIRAGVSKKFGTGVQAIENADGTFSLVNRNNQVVQKYPSSAAMAGDIGLNARTYTREGVVNAAQMQAAKVGSLGATQAAQGQLSDEAEATATTAQFGEDSKVDVAERDTVAEEAAKAGAVTFTEDSDSVVKQVTGTVADVEDKKIFVDYLITNMKLYFDKFEDELQKEVTEPTTQQYDSMDK